MATNFSHAHVSFMNLLKQLGVSFHSRSAATLVPYVESIPETKYSPAHFPNEASKYQRKHCSAIKKPPI